MESVIDSAQRQRLVRLCAGITGDRAAAEDLAQETLLEAWRNEHKLHDPAGVDRWLASIARNVCQRWARRRGRDAGLLARLEAGSAVAEDVDVEVDLERAELAELLDRALSLLPPDTREVLVHRYVHDSPHAEIGRRFGLSEDAVSMRLSRGKVLLRRVLSAELRDEAAAYGLLLAPDEDWRPTRIWCADCGKQRLVARRESAPGALSFRCPGCSSSAPGRAFSLSNPVFADLLGDVVRPTAILARAAEWVRGYFAGGTEAGPRACTRCGRPVTIARYVRAGAPKHPHGLFASCTACGEKVSSSAGGLALAVPEVRSFLREHPRVRVASMRDVESRGVPALVLRYEDALGAAGVDVVFARETLRVLDVHAAA